MVTVTRLVAQVLDDRINRRLLHDTGRIPAGAAHARLPATAGQGKRTRDRRQQRDRPHIHPDLNCTRGVERSRERNT